MSRMHTKVKFVNGKAAVEEVPFTAEEEATRDEEEKKSEVSSEAKLARSRVQTGYNTEVAPLRSSYSDDEVLTFTRQAAQAREWKKDSSVDTPLLDGIIEGDPEKWTSKKKLVDTIIEKSKAFDRIAGAAPAKQKRLEAKIAEAEAAQDIKTLQSITW